jgi:hypothetical protein
MLRVAIESAAMWPNRVEICADRVRRLAAAKRQSLAGHRPRGRKVALYT